MSDVALFTTTGGSRKPYERLVLGAVLLTALVVIPPTLRAGEARLRRPESLVLLEKQQRLLVAGRRSGTIVTIDTRAGRVLSEQKIGKSISSLVSLPGGEEWLLATDETAHQVLLLQWQNDNIKLVQALPVSQYPVRAVVGAGNVIYVSSLWSRRVTSLVWTNEGKPALQKRVQLDLPFAPREMLLVRDGSRLIVGDSYGGRLGVVDTKKLKLLGVRTFPGHNIRGLGISPNGKMLIVAHQMLNELAHTVRNDVHWGLLMSNDLRWLRLDGVLVGKDLYEGAHMHPLGEAGSATGDPSGLVVTKDGTVIVTLGGVGEVALGRENDFSLARIKTGRRPTAVVVDRAGKRAFVANTFDDSVSIIDVTARDMAKTISLGPTPKLTLADKGELLFFNAKVSHDGWMSCHSCHTNGHTNGLLNDNFSDASFGAPKRVLSLLGRSGTAPFAWNASAKNLTSQIRNSIEVTMQSDEPPEDNQVAAIEAFLKQLQPPPSIDRARGTFDKQMVARGRAVFDSLNCANCHRPPRYTSPATYDVGLEDKLGNRKFNPPSLIGVGQRGPYFHDNRATSLQDVFTKHKHRLRKPLSPKQLQDLLAFLRSL